MTTYVFGSVLTHEAIFSNNRGESSGNPPTVTLQTVFRNGVMHTTVSAEAVRYALREAWQVAGVPLNRKSSEPGKTEYKRGVDFKEGEWHERVDDDLLGFMRADNPTRARRAPLEVGRGISLTPWRGETMANFASAGTNASREDYPGGKLKKDGNSHPYHVEVHQTRYMVDFALSVDAIGREGNTGKHYLDDAEILKRVELAVEGMVSLRRVGGGHTRYFADYSAAAVVLRVTDDPAPRFLGCYEPDEDTGVIRVPRLLGMMAGECPDILPSEIVVGAVPGTLGEDAVEALVKLEDKGLVVCGGVKAAAAAAVEKVKAARK